MSRGSFSIVSIMSIVHAVYLPPCALLTITPITATLPIESIKNDSVKTSTRRLSMPVTSARVTRRFSGTRKRAESCCASQ